MLPRSCYFAIVLGAFAGCAKKPASLAGNDLAPLPGVAVTTAIVAREDVPTFTEIIGTVQAVERAQLAARLIGTIEEMPIILGQRVRAGDVLVRIAADDISARAAQARTELRAVRRELERERSLAATGASSQESMRSFEDRLSTAEARLREAEAMLAYTVIRAPFDGVVARKPANAGDLATPGVALLELHGRDRFEVEAAVPETAARCLKVDDAVDMTVSAAGWLSGKITEVSSAADVQARATTIKIAVPLGTPVHSGEFVRLRLKGAPRTAILVPGSAVSLLGQMERVFAVGPDGRVALRLVRCGGSHDQRLEILAGLTPGERIVVSPTALLRDGQRVEERR